MRWRGCCLLIGQSHALMDFPFLNWCHISLTAAGGRAGRRKEQNAGRRLQGKAKDFLPPRPLSIAWWVLPAGRGTSLLHSKSNATPGVTPGCRTSVCGPATECLWLNIAAAFPRVNDSHVCPQLLVRFYLNRSLRLFPYSPGSSVWVVFYWGKEL